MIAKALYHPVQGRSQYPAQVIARPGLGKGSDLFLLEQ